jgi:hypothetical protein
MGGMVKTWLRGLRAVTISQRKGTKKASPTRINRVYEIKPGSVRVRKRRR